MRYDFDEIVERRGTCSSKWDAGQDGNPQKPDCIPLWVADMDFACPPPVVKAVEKVAARRIYGYSGLPEGYYEAVCGFYKRRHHFEAVPEEIVFTKGVVSALQYAVDALTAPGDEVIVQPPVYFPFFSVAGHGGRAVSENRLLQNGDGSWSMDFEDLEKRAASPKAKALILCSPHNPVGRVWTAEELRKVEDICLRHGLVLLCDEIHSDLIRGGYEHVSVMELFPEAQNVVCFTAPSKTFNIAGLGVSHAFCRNPEIREKFRAAVGRCAPDMFGAAACKAAVTECDDWLEQMNAYTDENFRLFYELCGKYFPLAVPTRTEGTYLAWLDVRPYVGEETKELEKRLYDECGVFIESGDAFGGKGFLRVNLACPRSYIEEAFLRASLLLPYVPKKAVSSDAYLADTFLLAKKAPSLKDLFLRRMNGAAQAELDRKKGNVTLRETAAADLSSFLEESFEKSGSYRSFTRFLPTRMNLEIANAAFDSVKH